MSIYSYSRTIVLTAALSVMSFVPSPGLASGPANPGGPDMASTTQQAAPGDTGATPSDTPAVTWSLDAPKASVCGPRAAASVPTAGSVQPAGSRTPALSLSGF